MCLVKAFFCTAKGCPSGLEVLSDVSQIVLGLAVAIIAYQQWVLAKNKAKFDLYEKRYEAFKALKTYLSSVLSSGKVNTQDIVDFRWKFDEHYFLYDEDIRGYISEIYKESFEILRLQRQLFGHNSLPVGPERNKVAAEESKKLKWLIEQLEISKKKFDKYLRIK